MYPRPVIANPQPTKNSIPEKYSTVRKNTVVDVSYGRTYIQQVSVT